MLYLSPLFGGHLAKIIQRRRGIIDMWWRSIEPESMLIYCWWEEGRLSVDLLACLEERSLDALGLLVPGPVVESILFIEGARTVVCENILGFKGKRINAIADLSGEDGK